MTSLLIRVARSYWFRTGFAVLIIMVLVWFAGPLFGFGSMHPLETEIARIATIVALLVLWIITNLMHFGMIIVGLPYDWKGQMGATEVTGGSPYGITTISGGDGTRMPSANELDGARYQGRHVAEVAKKMFG